MRIIDITVPVKPGMAVFPGTSAAEFKELRNLDKDGKEIWEFGMTTITGTHMEAPSHSIHGGTTIDRIDLLKCMGPCEVIDVAGKDGLISISEVQHLKTPRILFKTGNSGFIREDKFYDDFTAISLEAAETLVKNGVTLVGLDYYGIERRGSLEHPVHKAFFKAGVIVVVGLDLSEVAPGFYTLMALPLKLTGLDGSPCRAVLIAED